MGSNAPFRVNAVHHAPRPSSPKPGTVYAHNPYCALAPYTVVAGSPTCVEPLVLPSENVHRSLIGRVEFVPYPQLRPAPPSPCPYEKHEMTRLFFGQLPYKVTDEMLQWMCELFAESRVEFPERITRDFNGRRQLTGCIHAYTDAQNARDIIVALNKRLLVDNTGVWYARTQEQFKVLDAYVATMKRDRSLRPEGMPYDSVVVEEARSTYVPPQNVHQPPSRFAWATDAPVYESGAM